MNSKKLSEREIISRIRGMTQNTLKSGKDIVKGIGDDCAVLRKSEDTVWLVTTDTLIERVHFDLRWHLPFQLGRKAAAVNLSDIAAMGGSPVAALLSIGVIEPELPWLEDFLKGFLACLEDHGALLVGGDTVKSEEGMVISVTAIGEAGENNVIYRSGAKVGDMLWMSGYVGEAAAGFELCRHRAETQQQIPDEWQPFMKQHLDPEPQTLLGRHLAASGCVNAMMDISDGLATDVAHMSTASKVGAEIIEEYLPVSASLEAVAAFLAIPLRDLMLRGGEDYQLLFAAPVGHEQALRQVAADKTGKEIYPIGRIVEGEGVYLVERGGERREIGYQGYDHFRRR